MEIHHCKYQPDGPGGHWLATVAYKGLVFTAEGDTATESVTRAIKALTRGLRTKRQEEAS